MYRAIYRNNNESNRKQQQQQKRSNIQQSTPFSNLLEYTERSLEHL